MQRAYSSTVFRGPNERVIFARGDIDLSNCNELREVITGELAPEAVIVIDLSAVTFMDSSAIGVLMQARAIQERQAGSFAVRQPSGVIRRMLTATGLDSLMVDADEGTGPATGPQPAPS